MKAIGDLGEFAEDMMIEYPLWRIVTELPLPLTEVEQWDLGQIQKAISILDMKNDQHAAWHAYFKEQAARKERKK